MTLQAEKEILLEMISCYSESDQEDIVEYLFSMVNYGAEPYCHEIDPNALCCCGHEYKRHFTDDFWPCGCKKIRCSCQVFKGANSE